MADDFEHIVMRSPLTLCQLDEDMDDVSVAMFDTDADCPTCRAVFDVIVPGNPEGTAEYWKNEYESLLDGVKEQRAAIVENTVKTMLTLGELYDREGVEVWLRNPHKLLKGRPAIELLYEGDDQPWRIAEGLADGVVF